MEPVNVTPFGAAYTIGKDVAGQWQVHVSVKATFTWDVDGTPRMAAALPIVENDIYVAAPESSGLSRAAELGPRRRRVDVLVAGALAFSRPIEEVDATLRIGSRVSKTVRVFGDRRWIPALLTEVTPSPPRAITSAPIEWERCWGGSCGELGSVVVEVRNPVGTGIASAAAHLHGRPAPTFEDPAAVIKSWRDRPTPRGFGPLLPHWAPRSRFAGRYDDAWRRERFPLPPSDFDERFFNVAPEDQQLDGYRPGEDVFLANMTLKGSERFLLPTLTTPVTIATSEDLIEDVADVDTVIIEPQERRFSLVAKVSAPLRPNPMSLRHVIVGELTRGQRLAVETGRLHRGLLVRGQA